MYIKKPTKPGSNSQKTIGIYVILFHYLMVTRSIMTHFVNGHEIFHHVKNKLTLHNLGGNS